MNDPYTYEDYLKDLLLVSRNVPAAGAAQSRIDHYEHGKDPYNLPPRNPKWDKFITIAGWCIAILVALAIIDIIF